MDVPAALEVLPISQPLTEKDKVLGSFFINLGSRLGCRHGRGHERSIGKKIVSIRIPDKWFNALMYGKCRAFENGLSFDDVIPIFSCRQWKRRFFWKVWDLSH